MVKFSKKKIEILSQNYSQTKNMGKILAKEFLKTSAKKALVLGLMGDLGGGKTTFLQGFAKGLGLKRKILSPSFVLMRKFKVKSPRFKVFYHLDCYRIEKPKEILILGLKEIISDSRNIVAIEWADRIKRILPKDTIILKFTFINKNKRKIKIYAR
jgi:tRNA threonylcarbamoyladenosine biosynthesis protein TsaE